MFTVCQYDEVGARVWAINSPTGALWGAAFTLDAALRRCAELEALRTAWLIERLYEAR